MNHDSHDPRDIPILTESVEKDMTAAALYDTKSVHAAVVTETLNLADSLLHQAAKSIEAALFERVFDELKAKLPELVDRILREQAINHPTPTAVSPGRRQEHD
jgi:Zn-dependent M32 family carboxypeptidase